MNTEKKDKLIEELKSYNSYGDEQFVSDVNATWLYSPHVVLAIVLAVGSLLYLSFSMDEISDPVTNTKYAIGAACIFIMIIGALTFPSGPFIRPHPVVWRMVFALGVIYQLSLIFIFFQNKTDARQLMKFLDPSLGVPLAEQSYAENCELNWTNLYGAFDIFVAAHFFGWLFKALMLHDSTILWVASIAWEFVEIIFKHMLPNFAECWWDSWILDVLICNGGGILVGTIICRKLEVYEQNWKGLHECPTFTSKVRRIVGQFGPKSWMRVRWSKFQSIRRFFAVHCLVIAMMVQDLNSFFLKSLLWLPSSHPLNVIRLAFWFLFALPSIRQLYIYLSDPLSKSIGRHAFLGLTILATEILVITKFGRGEYNTPMSEEAYLVMQVLLLAYLVFSIAGVVYILKSHPYSSEVDDMRSIKRASDVIRDTETINAMYDEERSKTPTNSNTHSRTHSCTKLYSNSDSLKLTNIHSDSVVSTDSDSYHGLTEDPLNISNSGLENLTTLSSSSHVSNPKYNDTLSTQKDDLEDGFVSQEVSVPTIDRENEKEKQVRQAREERDDVLVRRTRPISRSRVSSTHKKSLTTVSSGSKVSSTSKTDKTKSSSSKTQPKAPTSLNSVLAESDKTESANEPTRRRPITRSVSRARTSMGGMGDSSQPRKPFR